MDELLQTIRAAAAPDATEALRAAGAAACRTIQSALEAKPGEPIGSTAQPATPMQTFVTALRGMPPDQLLDLAIARLRAALPADADVSPVPKLNIPLLPMPRGG
jgi:hypothetical protein